jgi:hypothetical protein
MDTADFMELQSYSGMAAGLVDRTWRGQRVFVADFMTWLLRACRVRPVARWAGHDLSTTFEADGLLGAIAVLAAEEVSRGEIFYQCSVCKEPVIRNRAPRADEAIYCTEPACKREQRRRNQASWRARKAASRA